MNKLLPMFPFVAALALIACQRDDGPVAKGASEVPVDLAGDSAASGLATPQNSAAAEATARAALPSMNAGMTWAIAADGRSARFGPPGSAAQLTFACAGQGDARRLVVTRHHPGSSGGTATLSLTGAGHASSLPMKALTTPDAGQAEWQGSAVGDMARALERPFAKNGQVEVSLSGAPSLVVPAGPEVRSVFADCLGD